MFIEIPELKHPYLPFYDVLTEVKNIGTDYKFNFLDMFYIQYLVMRRFFLVD